LHHKGVGQKTGTFLPYKKRAVSYKAKNKLIVPARFAAKAATGDGYAKNACQRHDFLVFRGLQIRFYIV